MFVPKLRERGEMEKIKSSTNTIYFALTLELAIVVFGIILLFSKSMSIQIKSVD